MELGLFVLLPKGSLQGGFFVSLTGLGLFFTLLVLGILGGLLALGTGGAGVFFGLGAGGGLSGGGLGGGALGLVGLEVAIDAGLFELLDNDRCTLGGAVFARGGF